MKPGWTSVALGEVADIVSGATPKTGVAEFWDGDIPWATPKDLSQLPHPEIHCTARAITDAGLRSCAATVLPAGSVLFSSRAPIGHVAINSVPMATNQGFKSLVPKTGIVEAKYLYHWLNWRRPYLESLGNGATFKEISKAVVSRVELPLPPIEEQRRIASILDQAAALQSACERQLDRLEGLATAGFMSLFGDPITNDGGWPVASLGALGNWSSGGTPPRRILRHFEGAVPWFTSGELGPKFVSESVETLSPSALKETSAKFVPAGSILLGMYDTAALKCSISSVDGSCNQAVAFSTIDDSMASVHYVYIALSIGKERYKARQRGIRQKNLNLSIVRSLRLALPPRDEQARFDEIDAATDAARQRATEHADCMAGLFSSLQARAFSGRL